MQNDRSLTSNMGWLSKPECRQGSIPVVSFRIVNTQVLLSGPDSFAFKVVRRVSQTTRAAPRPVNYLALSALNSGFRAW
jgi:hypothetical protein